MSLQEHKGRSAEGGNATPGANGHRQQLERDFAVKDSFSRVARLTLPVHIFASLKGNENPRFLLWNPAVCLPQTPYTALERGHFLRLRGKARCLTRIQEEGDCMHLVNIIILPSHSSDLIQCEFALKTMKQC